MSGVAYQKARLPYALLNITKNEPTCTQLGDPAAIISQGYKKKPVQNIKCEWLKLSLQTT